MSTNEGPTETTLLDYECADCEFKWTEAMREEYGHCDEDCRGVVRGIRRPPSEKCVSTLTEHCCRPC